MNLSYRATLAVIFAAAVFSAVSCKKSSDETPEPMPGNSVVIDGKPYPTIAIANQVWTAANYAGTGGVPYDQNNTHPEYGRYYTFAELQQITIPPGWRLPVRNDFVELVNGQGADLSTPLENTAALQKITSKNNWIHVPGTNTTGFNAYPAGYIYGNAQPDDGEVAEFWTSERITFSIQESGQLDKLAVRFYGNSEDGYRFPVRFIKQ